MKISLVQAEQFNIPLPEVLTDAMHGEMRHFSIVVVRIKTDSGQVGVGYTYTVGTQGGSAILAMIRDDLANVLEGADPRRVEQLWEKMFWQLHYVGRGGIASFAMAAVDIALWDIKSKVANEPLWRFLGGHDSRARVYAGGIDLQMSIDQLARQTDENLDRGFRAIKMKVGREKLSEDVERVAAMRQLLGSDILLMVDANMKWTADEAIKASRAFADYDVYWLEEPTIPDDIEGHRRVKTEGELPVATGENLRTVYEFEKMISGGGVSFPEPDVSNIGGITPWLKVAKLAEVSNLPVTTHGVHELHVHLLAAVPNASLLEAHGFGLEKYIVSPVVINEGWAIAPDRPGHGVEFDWDRLESFRVDSHSLPKIMPTR
ncbi:MAG: mandelate racemase/muconate lactonizing enzyme family protein [Planctomycetota bacterium]